MTSLPESFSTTLKNNGESYQISVFNPAISEQSQLESVKKIKAAFPNLEANFFHVLLDRVRELKISDARLIASVNHVIDNCQYPTPTLAQFLSYDSIIEVLDYNQMVKKNHELNGQVSKFYKSIKLIGIDKPFWAKITDIQKYKLELFNKQTP